MHSIYLKLVTLLSCDSVSRDIPSVDSFLDLFAYNFLQGLKFIIFIAYPLLFFTLFQVFKLTVDYAKKSDAKMMQKKCVGSFLHFLAKDFATFNKSKCNIIQFLNIKIFF